MKKFMDARIMMILSMAIFGTIGLFVRNIGVTSGELALYRAVLAIVLIGVYLMITKQKIAFSSIKKALPLLMLSGVAMGFNWILLFEAYKYTTVSVATLSYYFAPVIVTVVSPVLFREKLTAPKITGFLLVLAGVVLVNGKIAESGESRWGLFCGAMSAVMYAFMVICNKKASRITDMENSTLQLTISFLTVAVIVGLRQGITLEIAAENWPWILFLGLVNTGIGCYFYFSSIGALPVQTVAICGYLEPLSAVLFSVLLLNESMTLLQILGAGLIIGGAVLDTAVLWVHTKT